MEFMELELPDMKMRRVLKEYLILSKNVVHKVRLTTTAQNSSNYTTSDLGSPTVIVGWCCCIRASTAVLRPAEVVNADVLQRSFATGFNNLAQAAFHNLHREWLSQSSGPELLMPSPSTLCGNCALVECARV
eukprot:6481470-Amphidinium_carterae.1